MYDDRKKTGQMKRTQTVGMMKSTAGIRKERERESTLQP